MNQLPSACRSASRQRGKQGCSTNPHDWTCRLEQLLLAHEPDRGQLDAHIDQALLLSKDEWIDAARLRWPQHAQRILRSAERVSENLTISCDGVAIQLSLIAIPLLFEFDEEIPASLFEQCLFPKGNAHAIASGITAQAHFALAPHAYSYDQLAAVPLSRVRRTAQMLMEGNYSCEPPTKHRSPTYQRRSRYLRYLLGHHFSDGCNCAAPTLDSELSSHLIERCVALALGVRSKVRVIVDSGYHACLYQGLWRYQQSRICQVASDVLLKCGDQITTQINMIQYSLGHDLELGFTALEQPTLGPTGPKRTYLLRSRPGDSPEQSLELVAQSLRTAGLESVHSRLSYSWGEKMDWNAVETWGLLRIVI